MVKITNDKYYTPIELSNVLFKKTCNIIGGVNVISQFVEPSAGNGSFFNVIKTYTKTHEIFAYDIEPECDGIIEQDYLTLEEVYKEGRLYIGNPPFGDRNNLSLKFLKKNILYGDYIAYIQPIGSLNGSLLFYEFDLIHSEDLGIVDFVRNNKKYPLHVCFNIWKRPSNGILNKKPNYKLKSVVIKEYRRNKKNEEAYYNSKSVTPGYDYSMSNWGNGTLGKQPEYVGQYSQEVYFYLNDKSKLDDLKRLLEFNTIRNYCKNISMKKIAVARLYKYLKDNGFE
jgi:hypothetical protein